MSQRYVVHALPSGGELALGFARSAVQRVAISGMDVVLTLTDGSQHLLQGLALRAMTDGGLRIAFTDGRIDGASLLNDAGKVVLTDVVTRTAAAGSVAPTGDATEGPSKAPKPADDEATSEAKAEADPEEAPAERPPLPPVGITPTDLGNEQTQEASFKDRPTPAPPPQIILSGSASPAAPGNQNPPPPPPPPPDRVAIAFDAFNVTGQQQSVANGKTEITGSGGVPASATDRSPAVQAAREQIASTAGEDVILGDGGSGMGSGFARVIEIQLSGRLPLEIKSVVVTGLPAGFVIVGATRFGAGWQLDLPTDLSAQGNLLRVMVQYPVAADDGSFSPQPFDLTIAATGVMDGKPIDGVLVVPAVVRDVQSAADMTYSVNGQAGFVLPAFGLGDEIRAGAGNDVVRGLVGHDLIFGEGGNDTLDGGAANDVLVGGAGADVLIGGTGRDTADYRASADGVTVDLVTGRGQGGEAEGDVLSEIENLTGGAGDDALYGDAGTNRLEGAAGDDLLVGRGGADALVGGDGFDLADYNTAAAGVRVNLALGEGTGGDAEGDTLAGIEAVRGSELNDVLTGDAQVNRLDGGAGDDLLDGAAGADQLQGGAGTDTATYAASAQAVSVSLGTGQGRGGDAEGDRLQDIEQLVGSRNADELTGDANNNRLDGGAGDDWMEGGEGADQLIGGTGTDTASYLGAEAGVRASLQNAAANTGDAAGDSYSGIENLEGSERNDQLIGDAGSNVLMGAPGDDDLQGLAGDDTLIGGAGADVLDGGDGIDTATYAQSNEGVQVDLSSGLGAGGDAEGDALTRIENLIGSRYSDRLAGDAAANVLDGGRGNDVLAGGGGADRLIGSDGSDTADYSTSADAVTINLAANTASGGDAQGDTFDSIENVYGGFASDVMTGDASANRLDGNDGDDTLAGNAGNDRLNGGDGDDTLLGGSGADALSGGAGNDTASYVGSAAVQVNLASGRGSRGDAEGDTLTGIENLIGGNFNDLLVGDAAVNRLDGGAGDDVLEGGGGTDDLQGGLGSDTASYAGAALGVTASLLTPAGNTGDAAGDSYTDIENLAGSARDDLLTGDLDDNVIDGGDGDDLLAGRAGADTLRGGGGVDTATYIDSASAVTVSLATGAGLGGDAEGDTLVDIENLIGSAGSDALSGDAADNRLEGRGGDDVLDGGTGADALLGGAGNDTASYASATAGVVANLLQSSRNDGDAAGDGYDSIENLSGSDFDDALTGDAANNRLSGGTGNDVLQGGLGADTLIGGAGTDTASYAGAATGVTASLASPATNAAEAAGDTYNTIENLLGSAFNDSLSGDAAANRLDGGDGDDLLVGGGGADALVGGNGSDTASYATAGGAVNVSLLSGRGIGSDAQSDTLIAIEHLIGSAQNDTLTGNSQANRLEGGDGDDTLDGAGGTDNLIGGAGDDTYVVDDLGDLTVEAPGAGTDLVRSSLGWTLGDHLENLALTGSDSIDATGNSLDNALTGNAGNNRLDGREGADAMTGGAGDDTYVVDHNGDTITEDADSGLDAVFSAVTHTLAAHVENLTLAGSASINATGNSLANRLTGNDGNNVLDGGAGADIMVGGAGNDTYVVDSAGDGVTEAAGQGNDTVRASISYVLGANLENLTLLGADNLSATGNAAANTVIGNAGNNLLIGGGGADLFAGGAGNDTIAPGDPGFTSIDGGSGTDTVKADGLGLTSLGDLVSRVSGVEVIDLSGSHVDQLSIRAAQVNASGFLGADASGRLEVFTNSAANPVGPDFVFVSSSGFSGVTTPGAAPVVTLSNGATGFFYAATAPGQAGVAVDANARVLPLIVELQNDWGLAADPALNTLSGVRTWLDATDLDGNGVSAGLSEAGLNGSNVAAWADRSGNANHLTQLAASSQPTLVQNGINGLATVRFADTDGLLSTQSIPVAYSAFAVARVTNQVGLNDRLISGSGGTNWGLGWEGGWEDRWYTGSNGTSYRPTTAVTGDVKLYSATASTYVGNFHSDGRLLGTVRTPGAIGQLALGAANSQSSGDVGEVVIFDRALSDAERVIVEGYLRSKWRLGGMPAALSGLPTVAYDTTWTNAQIAFGSAANDNLSVNYGIAAVRGTGRIDAVLFGGAGDDVLAGGARSDALYGGAGNDTLNGGAGADWLYGGAGNDTYVVDNTSDVVVEAAGAGTDLILSSVDHTLLANTDNLTLTGTGNARATGNALANTLIGNAGNNVLDGGAGADSMAGGAGSDTYIVDNDSDSVTEAGVPGNDTVRSALPTYTLGLNVENLVLTGAALAGIGNALDNQIIGNAAANTLTGGEGNDTLDGGAGADTLTGGTGNDVYAIDNAGDVITELASEGTDTIVSSIASTAVAPYVLGASFENLTLTGSALGGTGTAGNNVLTGNASNNTLNGLAGDDTLNGMAGADTLVGGIGNDTYWVDNASDVVTEASGAGTDTVRSLLSATILPAATFTLASNVENLVLTDSLRITRVNGAYANLPTVTVGGDMTLQAWVNLLGNPNSSARLFDTQVAGSDNVSVYFSQRSVLVNTAVGSTASVAVQSTAALTDGWHQISVTIDGQGLATIYIDGVASGTGLLQVPIDLARQFSIGRGPSGEPTPTMQVADVRVWDRALAQADVQATLTMGSVTGSESGLLAYHPFNGTLASGIGGQPSATAVGAVAFGEAMNGTGNALVNTLTGNSGDNVLDGGAGTDTMAGGGGDDTYVVDDAGDVVTEAAGGGTDTVRASIAYTLGSTSNLENLTLTGSANVNATGNSASNILVGNTGNNVMSAVGGNDTVYGGGGADTFTGAAGDDLMVSGSPGQVGLRGEYFNNTSFSGSPVMTRYENVNFAWSNGSPNMALVREDDISARWSGNVVAPVAGFYAFQANTDDSARLVVNGTQLFSEAGPGRFTSAPVFLNAGYNSIVLEFTEGKGGATAQLLWLRPNDTVFSIIPTSNLNFGGTLDAVGDTFNGGGGNDTMVGSTGADTMTGGAGNDTYVVDHVGDAVTEIDNNGTDTVNASIGYTLGNFVEHLVLSGTGNVNATGNALANSLIGNAGDNTLDGKAGADTMAGGAGNDTYVVDTADAGGVSGDVVTENANEGNDTVRSSVSHTLGANIENLVLTGTADLNGTGNALDNALTGTSGANQLDGGAGADTMAGGVGNDTYQVDQQGDVITENANEGIDTVFSSATHALGANVENLVLTGAADVDGSGNALSNVLTGNSGNNVLAGGDGNDTLGGAGGNDTLIAGGGVSSLQGGAGNDLLVATDASRLAQADGGTGDDTLQFTGIGPAFDLASLNGIARNFESLDLRNAGSNSTVSLDLTSLQSLTDSRHELVLYLDSGDTLQVVGEYETSVASAVPGGGQQVDYALYTSTDHTLPPAATLHLLLGA